LRFALLDGKVSTLDSHCTHIEGMTDLPRLLLRSLFLDFLEFAEQFGRLVFVVVVVFIVFVLLIAWDSC